jgi:nucleotide-binding universal stress UspA family protein
LRTIVVGYDGSEESSDALALGAALADGLGCSLVVAVIDEFHVFVGAPVAGAERAAYLKETIERAGLELGDREFEAETMCGSVPECLELIAERAGGDLLVIGSTHRGELGRVVPGGVGDRLTAGSPCSVAVAPRGYAENRPPRLGRVAVGFDGEEESREAVRIACDITQELGASLHLLSVAPAPLEVLTGISWGSKSPYLSFLHEQLNGELDRASACLPADFEFTGEVLDGNPADVIREKSADVDLLVLGSRGYGPLRRVFLGSVSSKVLNGSRCPVLVTPRSARKPRAVETNSAPAGAGG